MRMSATVEGLSATAQTSTPRALFTTLPPHVDTASLNRRLDYISVAIVCGIIIICFIICFIVGCRRTKRRRPPRCQDVSTPPTVSHSDTDGATGIYRETGSAANRLQTSRGDDSPPPTYSIIERQTSFTSSVSSMNSSMIEIPPTYDDAFESSETDLDQSGQWFASRGTRPSDKYGSLPSNQPGVAVGADRSGSLQHSRAPRLRSRRHYSDVTDPHRRKRMRLRARPSPLTENVPEAADDAADAVDLEVERSIDVIPEVTPGSPTDTRPPPLKDTASHHAMTSV